MKPFMWVIIFVLFVGASACQTVETNQSSFEKALGPRVSASYPKKYLKQISEKPLAKRRLKKDQGVYRMLVRDNSQQMHAVKVDIKPDGQAFITVKHKEEDTVKSNTQAASLEAVAHFLKSLENFDFWTKNKEKEYNQCGDEIRTGYSSFLFEGRTSTQYVAYLDLHCFMRHHSAEIGLAFYQIAGIEKGTDWTWISYFNHVSQMNWGIEE